MLISKIRIGHNNGQKGKPRNYTFTKISKFLRWNFDNIVPQIYVWNSKYIAKILIIYVNKKILALNHNSPHTKTIYEPQPFYFQTCITANAAKLWDDSTTIKP